MSLFQQLDPWMQAVVVILIASLVIVLIAKLILRRPSSDEKPESVIPSSSEPDLLEESDTQNLEYENLESAEQDKDQDEGTNKEKGPICPWCKEPVAENWKYCAVCGYQLDGKCSQCSIDLVNLPEQGNNGTLDVASIYNCPMCRAPVAHIAAFLIAEH